MLPPLPATFSTWTRFLSTLVRPNCVCCATFGGLCSLDILVALMTMSKRDFVLDSPLRCLSLGNTIHGRLNDERREHGDAQREMS